MPVLGPMFAKEMLETARRPRYVFARISLGLVGLIVLSGVYWAKKKEEEAWSRAFVPGRVYRSPWGDRTTLMFSSAVSPTQWRTRVAELARTGTQLLDAWVRCQFYLLVLLVPALVCGVVAREKEVGSLELLFLTHLTSREILLGKLASRIIVVLLAMAGAVPALFLVGLFGGVDYRKILLGSWLALANASLVAAISLYYSLASSRPWVALLRTYFALFVWLVVYPYLFHIAEVIFFPQLRVVNVWQPFPQPFPQRLTPNWMHWIRAVTMPRSVLEDFLQGPIPAVAAGSIRVFIGAVRGGRTMLVAPPGPAPPVPAAPPVPDPKTLLQVATAVWMVSAIAIFAVCCWRLRRCAGRRDVSWTWRILGWLAGVPRALLGLAAAVFRKGSPALPLYLRWLVAGLREWAIRLSPIAYRNVCANVYDPGRHMGALQILGCILSILVLALSAKAWPDWARTIDYFTTVVSAQVAGLYLLLVAVGAGGISRERERGTLDALVLAGISGRSLVLGNIWGTLVVSAPTLLLGVGTVTWGALGLHLLPGQYKLWCLYVGMLVAVAGCIAAGATLISVACRRVASAVFLGLLVLLAGWIATLWNPPSPLGGIVVGVASLGVVIALPAMLLLRRWNALFALLLAVCLPIGCLALAGCCGEYLHRHFYHRLLEWGIPLEAIWNAQTSDNGGFYAWFSSGWGASWPALIRMGPNHLAVVTAANLASGIVFVALAGVLAGRNLDPCRRSRANRRAARIAAIACPPRPLVATTSRSLDPAGARRSP